MRTVLGLPRPAKLEALEPVASRSGPGDEPGERSDGALPPRAGIVKRYDRSGAHGEFEVRQVDPVGQAERVEGGHITDDQGLVGGTCDPRQPLRWEAVARPCGLDRHVAWDRDKRSLQGPRDLRLAQTCRDGVLDKMCADLMTLRIQPGDNVGVLLDTRTEQKEHPPHIGIVEGAAIRSVVAGSGPSSIAMMSTRSPPLWWKIAVGTTCANTVVTDLGFRSTDTASASRTTAISKTTRFRRGFTA